MAGSVRFLPSVLLHSSSVRQPRWYITRSIGLLRFASFPYYFFWLLFLDAYYAGVTVSMALVVLFLPIIYFSSSILITLAHHPFRRLGSAAFPSSNSALLLNCANPLAHHQFRRL
jgi:hypothetical protein